MNGERMNVEAVKNAVMDPRCEKEEAVDRSASSEPSFPRPAAVSVMMKSIASPVQSRDTIISPVGRETMNERRRMASEEARMMIDLRFGILDFPSHRIEDVDLRLLHRLLDEAFHAKLLEMAPDDFLDWPCHRMLG